MEADDRAAAETRTRAILQAHGIGEAEAQVAARVMVDLSPDAWNELFLTREEVAHRVGISVSGVTRREIHRGSPEGARPLIQKRGAAGGRAFGLWFSPTSLTYYAKFPPRSE